MVVCEVLQYVKGIVDSKSDFVPYLSLSWQAMERRAELEQQLNEADRHDDKTQSEEIRRQQRRL